MIDCVGLAYSLLAMGIVAAIVLLGAYPLVHRFATRSSNVILGGPTTPELLAVAAVMSICYLALIGLLLCFLPWTGRRLIAGLALLAPFVAAGCVARGHIMNAIRGTERFFFWAVVVFSAALLILGQLNITLPGKLQDGAYVNKEHVTAVRIQRLTGDLPADNVVSFVVQEYLAKRIPLVENAPILPGQQVTNRPILASLVSLPVRLALRPVQRLDTLPRFSYVDTDWPDFRVLVRDTKAFSVFLGVGVFLNACLLLALGVVMSRLPQLQNGKKGLLVLLFCTSPYFIFQTLFTWPKALAGFFLILAFWAYLMHVRGRALVAGALIGLAYLSHPYAIAYLAIALIMVALTNRDSLLRRFLNTTALAFSFSVLVFPWWFWSNIVLRLESNLIAQNLFTSNTEVYPFLWMRIVNLWSAMLPMHLTIPNASFADTFVRASMTLSGAVGVLFVAAVALRPVASTDLHSTPEKLHAVSARPWFPDATTALIACLAASSLLLTLVFSMPAVPALHGWQPLIAILLCLGVALIDLRSRLVLGLVWTQVGLNVVQLGSYLVLSMSAT